jgi:hypothetical protein
VLTDGGGKLFDETWAIISDHRQNKGHVHVRLLAGFRPPFYAVHHRQSLPLSSLPAADSQSPGCFFRI